MLKRARITGYKSLVDAEITFADPLTLIIGPNASGKTNLFDALALLSRMMQRGSVQEAFDQEHRGSYLEAFSFDAAGLAGSMAQPEREMRFEIDVALSPELVEAITNDIHLISSDAEIGEQSLITESYLRYSIVIQTQERGTGLVITDETLVALDQEGKPKVSAQIFVDRKQGIPFHLATQFALEQRLFNKSFDVPLIFMVAPLPVYAHMVALRAELFRWHLYNLVPQKMQLFGSYKIVTVLPPDGSDLASFFYIVKTNCAQKSSIRSPMN